MFFILSKLLNFLIKPFFVLSALLIVSFFLKNKKWVKRIRIFVLVAFLFFTNGFIVDEIMRVWEVKPVKIESLTDTYEYGIVLGGITDPEREPRDRLYFKKGADRIIHAIYLYKAGKIKKILFTGGKSKLFEDPERESSPIKGFLTLCGVDENDIVIDNKSRNTHENALFSSQLIDKNNHHILLTSAFHMRRSLMCFKKVGLNVTPFPCDFNARRDDERFTFDLFVPSMEALIGWEILIKEWIGIAAYKLADYI